MLNDFQRIIFSLASCIDATSALRSPPASPCQAKDNIAYSTRRRKTHFVSSDTSAAKA